MRQPADRRSLWRAYLSVYRNPQPECDRRARSDDLEDQRRPAVLLSLTRHWRGRRRIDDRQRLLQGRVQGTADGVRGGSPEAAARSEEHTSELQSLMRNPYPV